MLTTNFLNGKTCEIENKTPDVSCLVNKSHCGAKIIDIEESKKELVSKFDVSILGLDTLATKSELKAEEDKIVKHQALDSTCFHCNNCFSDDSF